MEALFWANASSCSSGRGLRRASCRRVRRISVSARSGTG